MSQPAEEDFDPPIYTASNPLVWVPVHFVMRQIQDVDFSWTFRQVTIIKKTLPLTLELYAALYQVSHLIASKLLESVGQHVPFLHRNKYSGLSGLLIFVADLLENIHQGYPRISKESSRIWSRLDSHGSGRHPQ
jgi:hypothetical protein